MKIKVKIDGIHCDNCRNRIEKVLSKNEDIKSVKVKDDTAYIESDKELDHNKIIDSINSIGFETKEEYFK